MPAAVAPATSDSATLQPETPKAPPEPVEPPPAIATAEPSVSQRAPAPTEPAPPLASSRFAADVAALGVWGLGRDTPEAGARAAFSVRLSQLTLRLGGLFQSGPLSEAGATTTVAGALAGAGYTLLEGRLALGVRLDVAVAYLWVTRGDEQHGRWWVSLQPRLEGALSLVGPLRAFLAAGVDLTAPGTRIWVDGVEVADISPLAGAVELGVRVAV